MKNGRKKDGRVNFSLGAPKILPKEVIRKKTIFLGVSWEKTRLFLISFSFERENKKGKIKKIKEEKGKNKGRKSKKFENKKKGGTKKDVFLGTIGNAPKIAVFRGESLGQSHARRAISWVKIRLFFTRCQLLSKVIYQRTLGEG